MTGGFTSFRMTSRGQRIVKLALQQSVPKFLPEFNKDEEKDNISTLLLGDPVLLGNDQSLEGEVTNILVPELNSHLSRGMESSTSFISLLDVENLDFLMINNDQNIDDLNCMKAGNSQTELLDNSTEIVDNTPFKKSEDDSIILWFENEILTWIEPQKIE